MHLSKAEKDFNDSEGCMYHLDKQILRKTYTINQNLEVKGVRGIATPVMYLR